MPPHRRTIDFHWRAGFPGVAVQIVTVAPIRVQHMGQFTGPVVLELVPSAVGENDPGQDVNPLVRHLGPVGRLIPAAEHPVADIQIQKTAITGDDAITIGCGQYIGKGHGGRNRRVVEPQMVDEFRPGEGIGKGVAVHPRPNDLLQQQNVELVVDVGIERIEGGKMVFHHLVEAELQPGAGVTRVPVGPDAGHVFPRILDGDGDGVAPRIDDPADHAIESIIRIGHQFIAGAIRRIDLVLVLQVIVMTPIDGLPDTGDECRIVPPAPGQTFARMTEGIVLRIAIIRVVGRSGKKGAGHERTSPGFHIQHHVGCSVGRHEYFFLHPCLVMIGLAGGPDFLG